MEQEHDLSEERYDTIMPRDTKEVTSVSPALKLLYFVSVTAPSPTPTPPQPSLPEKKSKKEVLVVKEKTKRQPRGSHGMRRSRSFERRFLHRQPINSLPKQAKQQHNTMSASQEKNPSHTCLKDNVQDVVPLASKLRCEGAKSRDIENEVHEESHRHQRHENEFSLGESMKAYDKELPPVEQIQKEASKKTNELPILKHPAFTVAKLVRPDDIEAPQPKDKDNRSKRLSSVMLTISVKKSWLRNMKRNGKASGLGIDHADMESFSGDDESLTVQEARLAELVAERQKQIEAEMDALVQNVLFKLSKQKAKKEAKGPAIVHSSIADSDDDLENEIVGQFSRPPCPKCMKLPKKVEEKIESLVDGIDLIRCSSFVDGNAMMDPLEDLFFTILPRDDNQRCEKKRENSLYSVKDFISDSAKSVQSPSPKKSLDHRYNAGVPDEEGTDDYSSETFLNSYGDNTANATLGGSIEDATVGETSGTFNDTFERETYENETLGDYTVETIHESLYEQADLNEAIRLLKVRAARHGVSEAQLLERIQKEQRKRALAPNKYV